ncbi:TPA: M55 family metallopeptidase [Clostridioides difficile]
MNALIIADLEGISGVRSLDEIENCRRLFSNEINVYIECLKKKGIHKITVCDAHSDGNTLSGEMLIEKVELISKVTNLSFNQTYDFAIMAGFHGKNKSNGIYPHTLRSDIKDMRLCNNSIGEVELYCRWLGSKGIPVILVTGDTQAILEANEYNVYRQVCCVKSIYIDEREQFKALYNKIQKSIEAALQLDFQCCISQDSDQIEVELLSNEVADKLIDHTTDPNSFTFKNCNEFVSRLDSFFNLVNSTTENLIKTNIAFIKELRKQTRHIPKEEIADSRTLHILNSNPILINQKDRSYLINEIKKICSEYDGV